MANVNSAIGFVPVRKLGGGAIQTAEYTIASAYNSNIGTGDVVQMTGTGQNIQLSSAGTTNSEGVFAGCRYVDSQGNQKFSRYWPASTVATDIVAYVWNDPDIVFEIQGDTVNAADVGLLADWDSGTASTSTGLSGLSLAVSTGATTGKSVKILRLVPRPDNAYGAYAKVEGVFIEHANRGVVSGVGGN